MEILDELGLGAGVAVDDVLRDVRQGLLLLHEGVRSLNLRRPARPRDGGGGNLAGEGPPRGGLLVAAPFGARCEGLERVLAGTR